MSYIFKNFRRYITEFKMERVAHTEVIICLVLWSCHVVLFLLLAPVNVKRDTEHLKRIPLPANVAQVPNPLQPHHAKDQVPAEPVHHRQSEFS